MITLIIGAFGVALTLKASIGVGAWDALSQTGANLSGIKVGTVGLLMNFACVAIELLILKRDFRLSHAMQLVISAVLGNGVNFFYYDVMGGIELRSYTARVAALLAAYCAVAFSGACLILLDSGSFAVEGLCKTVGERLNVPFYTLRQFVDAAGTALCVLLTLAFNTPLTVREGTVLGMAIYGPLMGVFTKAVKPLLVKYDLADEK